MLIGGFGTWAAFCDEPSKCFAISQPVERRGNPFLNILVGRDLRVEAYIGAPVRVAKLRVGALSFDLSAAGEGAAADARISRLIVAAMRTGEALTIVGTSTTGRHFRHHYLLSGAPSAIDAAAIAAAGVRGGKTRAFRLSRGLP
ncbi:hypothetical protein [Sphingomonas crusticola]|uniref:hypothetical protein n=1 Tax=Sphingomonas crusticola TaxID=1697973 RepID=UPI0013C3651D|nr:hypothetical protein [Sphingomonas crusticola]